MDNPFLKHFPTSALVTEPRQCQIEILEWLWDNFKYSKKFGICAPCGVGKSRLGMAIAYYAKSLELRTLYTSPLNTLVDQLANPKEEFKIKTIKGRKHVPCKSGKPNAAVGFCQDDKCAKGLDARKCEYDKICSTCGCPQCIYRILFRAFRNSDIGNTNLTLFLMGIDNNPDIVVIDEADDCEDFIRMVYSLTVEGTLSTDFGKAIEQLKERADYLRTILENDGTA